MRDVDQELMAGAHCVRRGRSAPRVAFDDVVTVPKSVGRSTTCGKPFGARDEIAVGVGRQQRNVEDVRVRQIDAEDFARLRLEHRPGRHAADFNVVGRAELAVGPRCDW